MNETQIGRPKMADGEARDTLMKVRVRRAAKEQFEAVARSKGLVAADAHRQALAEWVGRNR